MRQRQTVTKDNTTGNTIVGETIYDLQGRPNLEILPTPTTDTTIKYFANFNLFAGQDPTQSPARYFDLTPTGVKCDPAPPLDITKGNGRYYSPNNDWLATEDKSKYIPNAEGYAYTETRYTDDATQRVESQGGVGINHQIGSGHDTKYFYGKPDQQEIDALFGTQVGYANHYFKNMVQDANGQMSVSYVDMHGRTIATALAGDSTSNLNAIYRDTASYPSTSALVTQLVTPESNIIKGNTIEAVNTILVPTTTNYHFTYKLDPSILSQLDTANQQVCFDCKYTLEISIRSEQCDDTAVIDKNYNNLQMVPSNLACDSSMGFIGEGIVTPVKQIDFTVNLGPGSWVVRKTLTLNDSLFTARRDSALNAFLSKNEDHIYDSVYNILSASSGCSLPTGNTSACDSCQAHLGTFSQYRLNYLDNIGADHSSTAYDSIIHVQYSDDSIECATSCGVLGPQMSTLNNLRQRMLADMIPYSGQYASATVGSLTNAEAKYNVMITNINNSETPYYRYPRDENGNPGYYFDESGQYDPTINPEGNTNIILDTITADNFANIFQTSWTKSLIIHHPEFTKLKFAEDSLPDSYDWMDKAQSCDTYTLAVSSGYSNPLGNDPYFVNNTVPADVTTMQRYISINIGSASDTGHVSIWRMANSQVLCAAEPDYKKSSCRYTVSDTAMDASATADQKDDIWQVFKGLYLSYRNEMLVKYINSQSLVLSQNGMDSLVAESKHLLFPSAQDLANESGMGDIWSIATNPSHDTTGLAGAVSAYETSDTAYTAFTDKCESQRILWKARLMQCEALMNLLNNKIQQDSLKVDTILNDILDGLDTVCHRSTDVNHVYGASNVNPSYGGSPQNFEDVINQVLAAHNIATSADSNYFCNPFTIDFPGPYDGIRQPLAVNYSNQVDSCGCSRFAALKAEAASMNGDTSTLAGFNQFLLTNYHDTLNATIWDGLQRCSQGLYKDTCYNVVSGPGYPYSGGMQQATTMQQPTMMQQSYVSPMISTCPTPRIDGVYHQLILSYANTSGPSANPPDVSTTDETLQVNYSIDPGYSSCFIRVYNSNGSLYVQQSVACGSSKTTYVSLPECATYGFKAYGSSSTCSLVGSSQVNASTVCNTVCPSSTVIDSVYYSDTSSSNNLHVNYTASPGATNRRVVVKDYYTGQTYSQTISDVSTGTTISVPGCQSYTIQVFSGSPGNCEDSSNVYYQPGCTVQCDSIYEPINLTGYVVIPPFLSCGYQKPCISCDKLDSLITEFKGLYPGYDSVPYLDSGLTDSQISRNALLTRFLNYRTGFSATVTDYLTAYTNCQNHVQPDSLLCVFCKPANDISNYFEPDTTPCVNVETQALFISHQLYELAKDSLVDNFDSLYKAKCLGAKYTEQFYAEYQPKEYHYTLYFYDQAGNLVKTLPPAAVKPNFGAAFLDSVATQRDAGNDYMNYRNNQLLATNYRYNTLNQVVEQKTPDAGISRFWYDRLGRLVVSQNAQQILSNRYSYTLYDLLGRITQVGQNVETSAMTQVKSQDTTALQSWLDGSIAKEQITGTVYDEAYTPLQAGINGFSGLYQQNLRNKVSYTYIEDAEGANWDAATFYSYDIHGNVDTLVQDYESGSMAGAGNRFKKIVYNYDLISGKVNEVAYQKGYPDQFYHKYSYDAENRITEVQTSKDSIYWERDALYDYYRHGPLARVVLGQNNVQGIDYAYTIQGWLKGVNSVTALPNSNGCAAGTAFNDLTISDRSQEGSPSVYTARNSITFEPGFESTTNDSFATSIDTSAGTCDVIGQTLAATDMGNDGSTGSIVAQDAYGFTLHYFDNGSTHDYIPIGAGETLQSTTPTGFSFASLYNGNIGAMSVNVPAIGDPLLYTYRYDQLNRINSMQAYKGLNPQTNSWEPITIDDYKENVSYDPNGNIKTYFRNGTGTSLNLNSYNYSYTANTNRLASIYNSVNSQTKTYSYDSIGNTTVDGMQGVTNANWNVYGKLQSLTNKDEQAVSYTYSADGQRISKKVGNTEEWYVRDAAGNIMATYTKGGTINNGDLTETEVYKYGSSLLDIKNKKTDVENPVVNDGIISFERGDDGYILSDQSGNTRAIVSDKKIQQSADGATVDYYTADVTNANLYSSFGAISNTYGGSPIVAFNGQRKSTEIGADAQTAQFWEYNGDVGRRWNLDPRPPLGQSYYSVFLNSPNIIMDKKGDTVILGDEFKNNKHLMESYRLFSSSKQGKKFLHDFGLTGKYSTITVNINSKNIYYGAGETIPFQ